MKVRLLTLAFLAVFSTGAFAQEAEEPSVDFQPSFTLEIGSGWTPIHTLVNMSGLRRDFGLADQGQEASLSNAWGPTVFLSAAWQTYLRWEFVLTGGFSWVHHRVTQYGTFGVDPQGKPRYDLNKPESTYWKDSAPAYALFFQARRFWNPTQKVQLYSAVGLGAFLEDSDIQAAPAITPIAVRFSAGHLRFFIENTYSPAATLLDAGLGWTF